MKNDTSLFSLRNIKILTNMQKKFFEILVQTALTVGLFWIILKLTPKSALLSFTILYFYCISFQSCILGGLSCFNFQLHREENWVRKKIPSSSNSALIGYQIMVSPGACWASLLRRPCSRLTTSILKCNFLLTQSCCMSLKADHHLV